MVIPFFNLLINFIARPDYNQSFIKMQTTALEKLVNIFNVKILVQILLTSNKSYLFVIIIYG